MTSDQDKDENQISPSSGRTTFNDIKGTKVYDGNGEVLGHVDDIEINRTTLNPTKLVIHQGFFGKYLRINLKYVDKITRDSIHLWISPAENLEGARVLDIEDNEIGKAIEAHRGKDGDLEYIKAETSFIRARNDEDRMDTYMIPMTSFEDMNISLPPASLEEKPILDQLDVNKKTLYIEADEIIDVGKDCIRLRGKKDIYLEKIE